MRLPTMPAKPCGTTSTGRPESNRAVSNTLSGILGSGPGCGMTIRSKGPTDGADGRGAAFVGGSPFRVQSGDPLFEGLLHRPHALALLGILGKTAADGSAHSGIGPGHAHDAVGWRLEPDHAGPERPGELRREIECRRILCRPGHGQD